MTVKKPDTTPVEETPEEEPYDATPRTPTYNQETGAFE